MPKNVNASDGLNETGCLKKDAKQFADAGKATLWQQYFELHAKRCHIE